eukprot:TRINITY_DN36349_c0_g1_i1.p1 TRINITY_DN36349_c0_g1~~TRINITY_DN36349_c0_g1_i1.p1  ORF type:complete len:768 (+),score=141.97 TRINITY_DN36349_c0_g1_i1:183-2486(+)
MFKNLLNKVGLGDLPSNFNYSVGDKVELPFQSLWDLHKGTKRSDGSAVSIFVCKKKDLPISAVTAAKNAEQVSKVMRHPNVLRAHDSCDVESGVYLVTEAVTPLLAITDGDDYVPAVWGLYQSLDALSFLHTSGFTHGLFGPSAIFVTEQGDYRLAGFELCRKDADPSALLNGRRNVGPVLNGWPEPPPAFGSGGGPTAGVDFWGASLMMAYVYGSARERRCGVDYRPDLGKCEQAVPAELKTAYASLQKVQPLRGKAPIADLLKLQYFQEHPTVVIMSFLSSLHIKTPEEKEQFFEQLPTLLDSVPRGIQVRQILPELLVAQKFPGHEGAHVLPSVLKIGIKLNEEEFKEKIAPLVVQLFTSPDRAIRFRLLVSLGDMIDNLDDAMINDKIFPECVNGFTDSNSPIREATVKSLIHFVPRLKPKTVESRVLKVLMKCVQDPEASIRTNTIICCGRISSNLPKPAACQMLTTAFQAGLKDPFAPCRSASLHTLLATASIFTADLLACQLLPLVCQRLVDPDPGVSNTAFDALSNLQTHMKTLVEENRKAQQASPETSATQSNGDSSGSWNSWLTSVGGGKMSSMLQMGMGSMGSMGSMTSSKSDATPTVGSGAAQPESFSMNAGGSTSSTAAPPPPANSQRTAGAARAKAASGAPAAKPVVTASKIDFDFDCFDDEESGNGAAADKKAASAGAGGGGWGGDDDDNFWDEFNDTPAEKESKPKSGGMKLGGGSAGASSAAAKPKAAAAATTVSYSSKEEAEFWKDFDM